MGTVSERESEIGSEKHSSCEDDNLSDYSPSNRDDITTSGTMENSFNNNSATTFAATIHSTRNKTSQNTADQNFTTSIDLHNRNLDTSHNHASAATHSNTSSPVTSLNFRNYKKGKLSSNERYKQRVLNIEEDKLSLFKEIKQQPPPIREPDSNEKFLLSLLPFIEQLSPLQNLQVRSSVQEVIANEISGGSATATVSVSYDKTGANLLGSDGQ